MRRNSVFWGITSLAGLSVLLGLLAFAPLERHYQKRQAESDTIPLKLAAESLRAALGRFAPLPALIAERARLSDLLETPDDQNLLARVNEDLRQTALAVGASDVFLMTISGKTIAAASYQQGKNLIDRNFNYMTYFEQALNGDLSSFQIYGTTTGEQGYFYGAPVEVGERIVGVLAVKFQVDAFESVWRGADSDFVVFDRNDFILMSSNPDWHFRAMRPLSDATRRVIAQNLQYPIDRIELLPITLDALGPNAQSFTADGPQADSYVMVTMELPELDWTIASLKPTRPATLGALRALLIAGLSTTLILMGLYAYLLGRVRQVEKTARQEKAKRALEQAVTRRTADLQKALAELKRTQSDLIQAGKMAGLGQMSAALSHELNQPLSAVKTYADNARAFLKRGHVDMADDNLGRISKMADRMASISAHLRNFARRPQQTMGPVCLNDVVRDALGVVDVRLKVDGGRVQFAPSDEQVWVIGGPVRLQQVVINLINNALDAMEGQADPLVEISIHGTSLEVRDHGPGIDEAIRDHLFDPFVTTKTTGSGLGLGLSISYNIVSDFGGKITGTSHPKGGSVFCVTLKPAEPEVMAAQ